MRTTDEDTPLLLLRFAGAITFIAAGLSREWMVLVLAYILLLGSWWLLWIKYQKEKSTE